MKENKHQKEALKHVQKAFNELVKMQEQNKQILESFKPGLFQEIEKAAKSRDFETIKKIQNEILNGGTSTDNK